MLILIFHLFLFFLFTPSSHGFPWRIFIVFPSSGLKTIIVIKRSFDAKSFNKLVYFRKLLQFSLNNSSFGETLEVSKILGLIFNIGSCEDSLRSSVSSWVNIELKYLLFDIIFLLNFCKSSLKIRFFLKCHKGIIIIFV